MNLPSVITYTNGNSIQFVYDAAGMKLRKIVKVGATTQYEQSYLGGLEYRKNGTGSTRVEAVYHDEGRYLNLNAEVNNTLVWQKEYTLKDHLGNARISFTDKNANGIVDVPSDIVQENHYYPFGLNYEGGWRMNDAVARDSRYLYNNKELSDDFGLNLYAYGARYYDAAIGRFTGVDPIADQFAWVSPYNYAENEPIANIDLHGLQKASIKDKAVGFAVGMLNALTSDMVGGAGRMDASSIENSEVGEYVAAGQKAGDILGIFVGGLETVAGGEAVIAGIVGAPETGGLSLGVSAVGVGLVTHGFSTQVTALKNLMGGDRVKATSNGNGPSGPYKRPSNATTKEQRASVQGKPCVTCGKSEKKMVADHKDVLVKEHYEKGAVDKKKMREKDAVQPQCPTCSARQGAEMSKYSKEQKKKHGFN